MSKRSSILKPRRTRNAFEDVNMDSPGPKDGDTGRFSRKVRFSSNFVKTFVTEDEGKDTIWDKTYEEIIEDSAQSTSTETMHVTKEKEKVVDKEQSLFVVQDNKENELDFSVNTSLFEKDIEKFTVFNDEENCNNHNKSLFDLSIKSKIGLSNITETSFQALDATSRVKMEIENALKVDDCEMSDNYTKAYEQSNNILFEDQRHKFSDNTRDDFEITASLPLQFSEEVSQLETSQNEIEFTVNHSMCLNGKELEFSELILEDPKKALEKSTDFPEENIALEFTEQLNKTDPITENIVYQDDVLKDSNMRLCEATGDTRHFMQGDMKFSFQVNDKTMEDLEFTERIHKDRFDDSQKTVDCNKSDADMKLTIQVAHTAEKDAILLSPENNDLELTKEITNKCSSENNDLNMSEQIENTLIDERSTMQMPQFNGKDPRKTILFSSENNDLEMTEQIGNKLVEERGTRKTMHFPKSEDDMEFTMQMPQFDGKDPRKTILFSSENNDLEMTEQIGNKLVEERGTRKTMHFPKSEDDMEFTMQMPQFDGKDPRKTILFSSENNDLEMTEQIGNKLVEERGTRKTMHFPKSEDDMEFTMQMPQFDGKDPRKTILFSSENNDLEMTEQIGNKLVEERGTRKTMHFPKSEDDMEFTMQMPQFDGKDQRKTILFSSENNDLDMTEQIETKLVEERGSRKTIHFPKSEEDMEFTMQMPQFDGKDPRKTILFSSENNDLEMTEQIGNKLVEERDTRKTIRFPKSEDDMEFTMQMPQFNGKDLRKTILFSSENNDLEMTEQIETKLVEERGSRKTIHFPKSEDDMEFTMQMPQFNGKDLGKTILFSSENNDLELTEQIENKLLEEKGLQLNENNSKKTILFSSDNNDLELNKLLEFENSFVSRKSADISKSDDNDVQFTKTSESGSRKSIPFSVENNILEIEDEDVTSNGGKSNENRICNVEVSEKIEHFQEADGDIEFTQQLSHFGKEIVDKENAKTILFSENNDLELTEKIDMRQNKTDRKKSIDVRGQFPDKNVVEKESRKTIYFPKSSNDMEFTMEMSSFIGKKAESKECTRKTILFSSDNNGMGLTEMTDFQLFKNVDGEKSDLNVSKSDDGKALDFGKQINRKTILFSDENNEMEEDKSLMNDKSKIEIVAHLFNDILVKSSTQDTEEIVNNQTCTSTLPSKESLEKEKSIEKILNKSELTESMPLTKSNFNKELNQQVLTLIGKHNLNNERRNKLCSSENDDLQVTERNSTKSENDVNNSADLNEEKLIKSTSLPKTNINFPSQNDLEDLNLEKENVGNSRTMFGKTGRTTILFGSENDEMEVTKAFHLNLVKDQTKEILKSEDVTLSKPIDKVLDANTSMVEEKIKKPNPLLKSKIDVEILTKKKLDNNLLKTGRKTNLFSSENNDMEITERIDLTTFVGKSKIPKFSNVEHTTSKVINQMFNTKTTHVADKSTKLGTALEQQKGHVTSIKMEVTETIDLNLIEERVKLSKSGSGNKSALSDAVYQVAEEFSEISREKSIVLEKSLISKVNKECRNKLEESLDSRRTRDKLEFKSKESNIDGLKMLVDRSDENIRFGEELMDGKMEMESYNCDFNNVQGSSYINVDEDKMQCEDDTYIEISSTCLQDIEKDVSSCDSSMRKRTLESVHKSNKKFIKESNQTSSFTEMLSEISFSESCGDFSRTANVTPRESLRNFDATVNFTLKLDQTTIVQEPYDPPKAQYTSYDLGEILRYIGPVHTETKDLKKSNKIIENFRNEMVKYEALLKHIRCDLDAQQKEDVNPTDKPFFEATTVPKTIREEVEEKQKLCNRSFTAEFPKERTCEVRALFGTILIRMEFDEVTGLVQQTEVVKKLSPKVVTPIIRYVHRLLLDKINDVKTSLGNSFSILTLLDYIHLHQGVMLRQRQEFEDMCKIYYKKRRHDIEMDENFIVNWHIVEVRLGFSCIVRMDPSKLSAEHIVIESEIGYFNNSEILELLTGCANNLTGVRKFVDRVSRMLVARGEEEFTTYMARYNHLFN